jgi:coproporphyrinogen III oxidase
MAPDDAPAPMRCVVCSDHAPDVASSICNWCNQRFHLNQRNDIEGRDCGQVWIDEQSMALQFACNNCLARESSTDGAGATRTRARPRQFAPRQRRYKRRA